MEVLSLNLIPTGTTPVVHVKQYDVGRTWRFELKEGPIVYTLDGSETIECDIKKKDGNVVTVAVTNTSASYIDIETTLQMTACSGDNLGAIRLKKGSDDIGTLNFILACERSPLENGIESESAIHDLATQVAEEVAIEVANQYDSANVIFDNEPTSGHGVGYAVTSEGVKNEVDTINTALAGKVNTTDFDATNLPITSGSATNTKDYIDGKTASASYSINNLDVYRVGNVVFFNIISGTNSTDANGLIVSGGSNVVIKNGYRPPNNVNVVDTVTMSRMTCNFDGTIWTNKVSQTGLSIRISACWITNDAFPT